MFDNGKNRTGQQGKSPVLISLSPKPVHETKETWKQASGTPIETLKTFDIMLVHTVVMVYGYRQKGNTSHHLWLGGIPKGLRVMMSKPAVPIDQDLAVPVLYPTT